MKHQKIITMLAAFFVTMCSAGTPLDVRLPDDQPICSNQMFLLSINDPVNHVTDIQFLDESSQVLYERQVKQSFDPRVVVKYVFIDLSKKKTTIRELSLDKNDAVIGSKIGTIDIMGEPETAPASAIVTSTHLPTGMVTSYYYQCSSQMSSQQSRFLDRFRTVYQAFQTEHARLISLLEVDVVQAQAVQSVRQNIQQEIDQLETDQLMLDEDVQAAREQAVLQEVRDGADQTLYFPPSRYR